MARYANRVSKPSPVPVQRTESPATQHCSEAQPMLEQKGNSELHDPRVYMDNSVTRIQRWMGVQPKLRVAPAGDGPEQEADRMAREVVKGGGAEASQVSFTNVNSPAMRVAARRSAARLMRTAAGEEEIQEQAEEEIAEKPLQRKEAEEEEMQAKPIQREAEEEEMQAKSIQREEEEESMQAKPIQREAEEEEAQAKPIQREAEEEEMQAKPIQREAEEEEMQAKSIQREEEEESMQAKPIQREAEEEEVQAKSIQREAEEEETQAKSIQREEEEESMQAKPIQREEEEIAEKGAPAAPANHAEGFTSAQSTHDKLNARRGLGEPMPEPLKNEMEAGFGADFSDVRIHKDQAAAELNEEVAAKAFTTGPDIFFGKGQFDAQSEGGKELIAHELTHTIQQGAASPSPKSGGGGTKGESPIPASEEPAEVEGKSEEGASKEPETPAQEGGAEEGKGEKEEGKEKKARIKPREEPPLAPADTKEDPAFEETLTQIEDTAAEQQTHELPEDNVAQVDGAAMLGEQDQAFERDGGAHLAEMDEEAPKEREPISAAGFKKILKQNLADLEKQLPDNEDEAEDFKEEKPIEKIGQNIAGQVAEENSKVSGPLNETAKQAEPPAAEGELREEVPLVEPDPGVEPANINPEASAPKPMLDHQVSMEQESEDIDTLMEEHDITDDQLAKSNEPKFTGALESKNEAQKQAAAAPVRYRAQEEQTLANARANAEEQGNEKLIAGMYLARTGALSQVFGGQNTQETSEEEKQKKINEQFAKIYDATKEAVTKKLDALGETVDTIFETEAEAAQKTFEENVEEELDDIYGITVIDDWLFGEDTEAIEKAFRKEKDRFVRTMDGILDRIAKLIADELNAALGIIQKGKDDTKKLYDGLSEEEKKLAEDSYETFNDQYADLEETVYEKQDELAADLAQSYKENVDSLRETFDKIKEEVSAGWIGAALKALWWVIEKIIEIAKMLAELLAAVVEAIGAILSDPIGFLSNLIDGVKQGFDNFVANIKTHIVTGLIEWLTGSLGGVGITLPENIFSLPGIFSLSLQIMGLTWDYFRSRAAKLLGEKVVGAMEYGFDLFLKIKNEGVMALWEEIKGQFQDLQAVVMDAIRDMVITKVIEAGVKWILGLLNPAGAFIKAAMLIIDVARFFIERAAQIIELVRAFIEGIRAIARGDVAGVAKAIETALAKAIPVLISFMAALVGVSGLTKKVTKIIGKLRKRVNKAIDKVIKKVGKVFKKGGKGTKPGAKDKKKKKDEKKHQKYAKEIIKELKKAPKGDTPEKIYKEKRQKADSLEKKYTKKVEKGIKVTVQMEPLKGAEKDGDIDFKVRIAPNATEVKGSFDVKEVGLYKLSDKTDDRAVKVVFQNTHGKLKNADPKHPQNYLAQVIGTPDAKAYGIANKYLQEAWAGKKDIAAERFSLVLGLNLYEDYDGKNEKKIKDAKKSFSADQGYPLGVVGMMWTPTWQVSPGKKATNRYSIKRLREEVGKLPSAERSEAEKKIREAEGTIPGSRTKYIPYGKLRDMVNNHTYTSKFVRALKDNTESGDVYIKTGDTDAVSLAVKGSGDIQPGDILNPVDGSLFEAYDAIIKQYQKQSKEGKKPTIASGGYRFQVMSDIGGGDHLRALANQADQEYRQAMAKFDKQMVYWPEPNTLFKVASGKNKLEGSFGKGGDESKNMVKSLIEKRGSNEVGAVYDSSAAITSFSERFYAKYSHKPPGSKQMTQVIVEGKVLGAGVPGTGGVITLEKFRSLFGTSQLSFSRGGVIAPISGNPAFPKATEPGASPRLVGQLLNEIYTAMFPHTAILGADVDNQGAWLGIAGAVNSFGIGTKITPKGREILKQLYGEQNSFVALNQIVSLFGPGPAAVKSWMVKLFQTVDPI